MFRKRTLLAGLLAGLLSNAGYGQITFQATDGVWNLASNWDPAQIPGPNDTAVIPDGKTCRIEQAAVADTVNIQSGGTLRIDSASLTIDDGPSLTVDGTLQFKKSTGTVPSLVYLDGDLTIDGTGTINCSDADSYGPGLIENDASASGDLTFSEATDVIGPLRIHIAGDLDNDADFTVVDADDTMEIGVAASGTQDGNIIGSGSFVATAGTIQVGRMSLSSNWSGLIQAVGGTFHLTQYVTFHLGNGRVEVASSGHIQIDTLWVSQGGYSFENGTIQVASGKSAYFER
jgi:hypothetical protein